MGGKRNRRNLTIFFLVMALPVLWLGLLIAPYVSNGLVGIALGILNVADHPFQITFCSDSLRTVLVCELIYGLSALLFLSSQRNYRRGVEHGSASWGQASEINHRYSRQPQSSNKILTRNVSISLNTGVHMRNLNTGVIGGSGAGKTYSYVKPNLIQANTSFVVTDPKGEILRDCGNFLKSQGYSIKILDLIHMELSHCYNPFAYLEKESDVQQLVTNLFKATTPKQSSSGSDPFWEGAAQIYLLALIFYLLEEAPQEEQNFATVMTMIGYDKVTEEDAVDPMPSPVEVLFYQLEQENPDSMAVKYYKNFKAAAGKTLKSIQITLIAHLDKFNLTELAALTRTDEMELEKLGTEKTVIFALIPDNDTSFNFLVSMLYTQLFQKLFRIADDQYGGALPVPVHFLMDEFANIALPDDFDKILSVMRSRNIFVSIILQNLSQLKALFEKQWESIMGNLDELVYLGGNEQSTHKYISELLGKETIDSNTYGLNRGRNGSYTTNYQIGGRELMTPDEVRRMKNKYALLFIRGEQPVMDLKYNLKKHPNKAYIVQGGASPFHHGLATHAQANISVEVRKQKRRAQPSAEADMANAEVSQYELLSDEDVEAIFTSQEETEQ